MDEITNKFTFTCVDCDGKYIHTQFDAISLYEILPAFTQFLRGCGYVINYDEVVAVTSEDTL
jgi:hypothetical protein